MFKAIASPYLVAEKFRVAKSRTAPPADTPGKKALRKSLDKQIAALSDLQRRLYAQDRYALLLVFQAMDAAGKDGTIRAVMTGVNPAGCQVFSFKQPSAEELDHDFLWRTARRLPERGRIGIFNRSYYEEVLVVRVHPEYLEGQRLPYRTGLKRLWKERYESISDHENHLARNGTVILKFWLNVSRDEQRRRFLERIDDSRKNWKFSDADVRERKLWNDYMRAYQDALHATSQSWAPWYAIPADNKPYMRLCVAQIVVKTLESLRLRYPQVSAEKEEQLQAMRSGLKKD